MSDDEKDGPLRKKRRVTKACDQCRRKRIKCETFPNAEQDAPCAVCTEAGTSAACTYSRPSRKRGPTAGYAKSLSEKVATMERLLGHLLLVQPSTLDHIDAFFNPPGDIEVTTSESQYTTFQNSPLPSLIEASAPVAPPESNNTNSSPKNDVGSQSNDVKPTISHLGGLTSPSDDAMSLGETPQTTSTVGAGSGSGWSPATSPPSATGINALSISQRAALGLGPPISSPGVNPFAPRTSSSLSNDLHTLASAATYGVEMSSPAILQMQRDAATKGFNPAQAGEVPTETVRNQLMELYFQIVHPSYPMVDKARFFRWSAHLPSRNPSNSVAASSLPPELYFAVFAVVTPYLSPADAATSQRAEVLAASSRAHLFNALDKPTIETVQACSLLALSDWGQGELERAWTLSSLAIALAITLSLHITATPKIDSSLRIETDQSSFRLKTFHSALIIHALLSLRLLRPPMSILDDYDIPVPPQDGPENFELWRSDKSPEELRAEHESKAAPVRHVAVPRTQAVRSCALSTFSHMASLCAIALSVVRWGVCPRRGNGRGLPAGEQEREELVANLRAWEADLPSDLRLSDQERGVERLHERSRHTVEMHLLLFTLYQRLVPHVSFLSVSFDPVPQALAINSHIFARYLDLYTFYRSLPTIDLSLNILSETLFTRPDYLPHQHDVPLKAFEELSRVLPVGTVGLLALRERVEQVKNEQMLKQSFASPLTSLVPPQPLVPAAGSHLVFDALANPGAEPLPITSSLFPPPPPEPSLWDHTQQWDQSDLLVSLGLVSDPSHSDPWQPPAATTADNSGTSNQLTDEQQSMMSVNGGGSMPSLVYGYDFNQQQSTDLLTRWLDRGSLAFGSDGSGR
ncbi:hypothetical protein T439DRAFT_345555 [Meredithblackwellia eburnea MCA 4105]